MRMGLGERRCKSRLPHRITMTELMRIEQSFGVLNQEVATIIKDL